jgi:ribosomal protein S18 acetylase RimI-like enzyme
VNDPVRLRPIGPDDWALLRDVRLRALADAPHAFSSTFAEQQGYPDTWWQARTRDLGADAATFAAVAGGRWVGVVRVYRDEDEPTAAQLVSMWVDPAARGRGIGRALVERALAWAGENSVTSVRLWVTEGNAPALRLYEACGFELSGERQPLPSDPSRSEIAMRRGVARP